MSADEHNMTQFIALSLDVAGSTDAKDDLERFVAKWDLDLAWCYHRFARSLTAIESNFLSLLKVKEEQHGVLEIDRLFLVKLIGDEWWYTYSLHELDDQSVSRHATHLLELLMTVAEKEPFSFTVSSEEPDEDVDGTSDPDEILRRAMPLKITCDLVRGYDFFTERFDSLKGAIGSVGTEPGMVTAGNNQWQERMRNAGGIPLLQSNNEKVEVLSRSDFIGMNIDRFFRCTSISQALAVTVGSSLYSSLDVEPTNGFVRVYQSQPGQRTFFFEGKVEHIVADDMKGIADAYDLYLFKR